MDIFYLLTLYCILGITPAYKCERVITPPPGKCELHGTCTSEPRKRKKVLDRRDRRGRNK